jgi:hypothetical protein
MDRLSAAARAGFAPAAGGASVRDERAARQFATGAQK